MTKNRRKNFRAKNVDFKTHSNIWVPSLSGAGLADSGCVNINFDSTLIQATIILLRELLNHRFSNPWQFSVIGRVEVNVSAPAICVVRRTKCRLLFLPLPFLYTFLLILLFSFSPYLPPLRTFLSTSSSIGLPSWVQM